MEQRLIVVTEERLAQVVTDAIDKALNAYKPYYNTDQSDKVRFGDIDWLINVFPDSISESTILQKSAKNQIPGKTKFGKRVLYDKETVLKFLSSGSSFNEKNKLALIDSDTNKQFDLQQSKLKRRDKPKRNRAKIKNQQLDIL